LRAAQNNNPGAISYQWIPSNEYIQAAIALGAFIGNLFKLDVLGHGNIATCLNTVMQNFVAFEHVLATQALVRHTGFRYWCINGEGTEGIRQFESVLITLADRLHDKMSVLRRTLGTGEVKQVVGGILMRCDVWLQELQIALHAQQ
jgi:hypothetical protein